MANPEQSSSVLAGKSDCPLAPPKQPRTEEAPRGVSAGRKVAVFDKNESLFLSLPDVPTFKIIRHLSFREIIGLAKVCSHFHQFIKTNKTVEKIWYRRFPAPHQYQLKTIATAKNDEQKLRNWLQPFANENTRERD
ncbi:F-box protein [Endozoicomonas sp. 4G]|uniref:F-box protein n=1 Tax=Endozoicomonas sp. 4G TaxID=2872754 RepID=UPI002078A8BE|nr:F-box protein [Endozoicomonas sp. 4G]